MISRFFRWLLSFFRKQPVSRAELEQESFMPSLPERDSKNGRRFMDTQAHLRAERRRKRIEFFKNLASRKPQLYTRKCACGCGRDITTHVLTTQYFATPVCRSRFRTVYGSVIRYAKRA